MQPTDIIIDFTTGLSGSVAWPWPIAVYLFLAGISGGAVALAVILNLFSHSHAFLTSNNTFSIPVVCGNISTGVTVFNL